MFRIVSNLEKGRMVSDFTKGSHVKMRHDTQKGVVIFPNHGSQEVGKGLEKKLLKDAGIKFKK